MLQETSLPVLILLTVVASWIILRIVLFIDEEVKIRNHGGHAPRLKSWVPFGLSFIVGIVTHSLRDQNLEFMFDKFRRTSNGRKSAYTFETRLCGTRWVFTADPENVKAMLATQFNDYGKGKRMRKDWHDLMGDSIFTADGERWHESRQRVRKYFVRQRVSDLDCFESHIQELIPLLGGERTVNVKDLFSRYALDVSGEFSFGRTFDALKDRQNDFSDAFDRIRHTQALIERAGPASFLVPQRQFRHRIRLLRDFIKSHVVDAAALTQEELDKRDQADKGYTFLHACASSTTDQQLLLDEVMTVLIAGRDTTAATLTFCFFELARNPAVVEDLRREIEQCLGFDRVPTYADLKSMKLVQNIVNETLRLYPIVPFNVRVALRDTHLPRGGGPEGDAPVGIPEGTSVVYSTHVMHLRRDSYPDESDGFPPVHLFHPRRWDRWQPKPWTYIPFNGGPRICVGQQFALVEVSFVLVRVFQHYRRVEPRIAKTGRGSGKGETGPDLVKSYVQSSPRLASDISLAPRGAVELAFYK